MPESKQVVTPSLESAAAIYRVRRDTIATKVRWLAYCLVTVSFGAAILLKGGVFAQQWEWSALGISIAAAGLVLSRSEHKQSPNNPWGSALLLAPLVWMVLQLVPLPPALLHILSPARWDAVAAAREATGQAKGSWTALSLAPGLTMERLLDVIPAVAAFVAAREIGWWWRDRMWVAVAPVIGVAWIESLLGLAQFQLPQAAGGEVMPITGTYVNRNHFAGLLEMAFPLAVMAAIAVWWKGPKQGRRIRTSEPIEQLPEVRSQGDLALRIRHRSRSGSSRMNRRPVRSVLVSATLVGAAACLLMGVVLSQSRAGFISMLIAAGLMMLLLVLALRTAGSRRIRLFRWGVLIAAFLLILFALPTQELILRFADMDKDNRMKIWRDTLHVVSAYKWTGTGLGAYERGLYLYKTFAPTQTVDFAHNDYLQIVAELGIIGAALVAALGLWILWQPLQKVMRGRGSANWWLAVGLLGALLTQVVHSLVDFNLYIPANALALAWLSGVAASLGFSEKLRRVSGFRRS